MIKVLQLPYNSDNLGYILPADGEALILDMPLEVTFAAVNEDITLPYFKPAGDAS